MPKKCTSIHLSATSAHKSDPLPGAKKRGNEKEVMDYDL
jgi:hypothetical protein